MGANSRLGAYSNKYGIQEKQCNEIPEGIGVVVLAKVVLVIV